MSDRFGKNISVKNVTSESFEFTVPVCVSNAFFAWVFQFAGNMVIVSPDFVQERYITELEAAIDEQLSM